MNKTKASQNDYKFFVLRRKLSNSESTNKYEDIFCVIHDSNVLINQIDEDNTNENRKGICQTVEKPFIQHGLTSNDASIERHYDPSIKKEFNLKLFREYLMTFFNVDIDSDIFYTDENNQVHTVQTETEFLQLWKLAKSYAKHSRGVLLLIDFTNDQDDDTSKDTISVAKDQTSSRMDNIHFSEICQSDETITEVKEAMAQYNREYNSRIFHLVDERSNNLLKSMNSASSLLENMTESGSKVLTKKIGGIGQETTISSVKPVDLTENMGDTEVESTVPFIINSQDFQNNVAPPWFLNYMVQLKKVIVKEVLDELTSNRIENFNKFPAKSPIDTQDEYTLQFKNCQSDHQSSSASMDLNDTMKSMKATKDAYKPGTDIKRETLSKCDSISSELADLELYVKERLYASNIPEETECCMKYSTSKDQTDENRFKSEACCCGPDVENISISSDIDNTEEVYNDDNFEIIQKPSKKESTCNYVTKEPFFKSITPYFTKLTKNKNSKSHACVESLTKVPSASSSSIYIDDDHFTACSNNIPTSSKNTNFNIRSAHKSGEKNLIVYEDDDKKILQKHVSNKCIDNNVEELSKKICKTILEGSSKAQVPKPERDSYENTDFATTQCYCRNDLTENFHSHAAPVAENCVHIRENSTSKNYDYSKHNLLDSNKPTNSKGNKIDKQISNNFNYGNPEKQLSKEESNATYWSVFEDTSANSTPVNAEPVHILPETLVTGAFHLASFAYGTAREAITKIRSNSKDD